jgi:regulator of protease activity HflC (stomatin/prohibitin superfamily)
MRFRSILPLIAVLSVATACARVPAGYVGIKVNQYGDKRGVQNIPIVTGRVVYNPFTEDVYRFPTFIQSRVWDKAEAVSFNSVEGAQFTIDLGAGIAFKADSVPNIFTSQRKDPEYIIDVYVRNHIRDAFSNIASKMPMTEIYGAGKSVLVANVRAQLDSTLGRKGYIIDNLSIIGRPRMDETVERSINAALAASQKAIEAQNKVAEAKALADQAIATARGDSTASVVRAAGQSQANRMLQATLSPQLIQYEAAKKWNGQLPTFTGGGAMPFVNIPKP